MNFHVIKAIFKRNFVSYFSNPTGYVFICVFVLLSGLANAIRRTTDNRYWELLDPWRDIRYVGRLIFGGFETTRDQLGLAMRGFLVHTAKWRLLGERPELGAAAVELQRKLGTGDRTNFAEGG